MNEEAAAWERFFPIFQWAGVLPEPEAARVIREAGCAELSAIAAEISCANGKRSLHDLWKKQAAIEARLSAAIEAEKSNAANYAPGVFVCEDPWRRVTLALLQKHEYPGFKFEPPSRDRTADRNYHRRLALESVHLVDRQRKVAAARAEGLEGSDAIALAASIDRQEDLPAVYVEIESIYLRELVAAYVLAASVSRPELIGLHIYFRSLDVRRIAAGACGGAFPQLHPALRQGMTLPRALNLAVRMTDREAAAQASVEIAHRVTAVEIDGKTETSYGKPPSAGTLRELSTKRDRLEQQWRGYPGEHRPWYIEAYLEVEEHFAQLLWEAAILSHRLENGAV